MALTAGDIAFIGFNADGTDGFAIVALVPIPAGTVVYFRDDEWNATSSSFNTGEGIITWTVGPGGLAAGATVEFASTSTAGTLSTTNGTVSMTGAIGAGNVNLGGTNEVLYAYTSTGDATTGTFTFVTAFANGGYSTANGELGAGLTVSLDANNFTTGFDVFAYSPALGGSTFTSKAAALAALTNTANWVSQDGAGNQDADSTPPEAPFLTSAPLAGTTFTLGAASLPTVNLSVSTAAGTEAGTTAITVTATASAAVTGDQTVNLAVTGTNITAGDYSLSNNVIAIAGGATTGFVTFTVVDDAVAEALETAVLTISGPSTGLILGSTVTATIDITDNDAPPDTQAPTLVSRLPVDDGMNVGIAANLVLGFDENVKAGTGNFVIKRSSDNAVVETIAATDAKINIALDTVTINPVTVLDPSTGYYVEADATAITDISNNAWAGLSGATAFNFTTAAPFVPPALLITEVNSNAAPADYFELYNYGTTGIDLTGWKWTDAGAPAFSTAVNLPFISLAAGEKIVIVAAASDAAFRADWGLSASVATAATGGPDLAAGDAVLVYDASGNLAASINYGTATVTASDNRTVSSLARADTLATVVNPAGAAVGGAATTSAVWDGISTSAPTYTFAKVGEFGGLAQTATAANIGSPGATPTPGVGASITTPVLRPFTASLGDFTVFSADTDTANTWTRITTGAGQAEVNGFGDTAPADDWLITRGFNLNQTDAEYLSFTTWTRFSDTGIVNPEVKIRYSLDYSGSGNPTTATWTDLSYVPSPENSQIVTPSGLIDLSAISGANVYFAFQYTSTSPSNASTWRVDDVKIEGYAGAVLSIAPANTNLVEGAAGTVAHTFTVTRSGDTSAVSSANWAVTGSAADAADFGGTLPSGTVSFAAGETTQVITVNATGDTTPEINENFSVTLSAPSAGTTIVAASAVGTIVSDDAAITRIHTIQGSEAATTLIGADATGVTIQGVVTAFKPNLQGFYIQEEPADQDANSATSEGIFVFYGNTPPAGLDVSSVGDIVQVTGNVSESDGMTRLTALSGFQTITPGTATPTPTAITLPVAEMVNWEAVEGMLVTVSSATPSTGQLVVTDNFNYGRYGQLTLTSDELLVNFTEANAPSTAGYAAYIAATQKDQIVVDDSTTAQNTNVLGADGNPLSAGNTLRAGSSVGSVTGVLDQSTANPTSSAHETTYRIQTTESVVYTQAPRPTAADLPSNVTGAEIKVASVNVLNYFTNLADTSNTTLEFTNPNGTPHSSRGANTAAELQRQQDKLVANIQGLNADVIGLMEMQNNGFGDGTSGIDSLVDALNAAAGAGTYAYVAGPYPDGNGASSATAGDDAIMVGFIYKPSKVTVLGTAVVPDVALTQYDAFTGTYGSRVPVAVTFQAVADNEVFTVVSNHFKSKGSATAIQGVDAGDGAGNANTARDRAATQLLDWLSTNPTGTNDTDVLLIGDFNAYSQEQPITTLLSGGYTKVSTGLSYAFDGLWGSLDHAISSSTLTSQVAGAVKWGINAEEPTVLDYNVEFKNPTQQSSYYATDAYRSSDHNPVLIGLNLGAPTVNLSLSSNAGTEAGTSVITITATAAYAVVGNQTLNLNITGTGITAGDYSLSNDIIAIANGATVGSVTFTVVNDTLVEGAETAVATISAPSAGLILGSTTTRNISITSDDVAASPPPPPPPAPPAPPVPSPVPASAEDNAPALVASPTAPGRTGDGNGDGRLDSTQNEVQSVLIRFTDNAGQTQNSFVTLVIDSLSGKINSGDTNIARVNQLVQANPLVDMPAGFQLPVGQMSLSGSVGLSGITETFSLYVDPSLGINGYWAQDQSGVWVNLASAPYGGAMTIEGNKQRLDFSITDGGTFDADGLANGIITQTGAAAFLQASIVGQPIDLQPDAAVWF